MSRGTALSWLSEIRLNFSAREDKVNCITVGDRKRLIEDDILSKVLGYLDSDDKYVCYCAAAALRSILHLFPELVTVDLVRALLPRLGSELQVLKGQLKLEMVVHLVKNFGENPIIKLDEEIWPEILHGWVDIMAAALPNSMVPLLTLTKGLWKYGNSLCRETLTAHFVVVAKLADTCTSNFALKNLLKCSILVLSSLQPREQQANCCLFLVAKHVLSSKCALSKLEMWLEKCVTLDEGEMAVTPLPRECKDEDLLPGVVRSLFLLVLQCIFTLQCQTELESDQKGPGDQSHKNGSIPRQQILRTSVSKSAAPVLDARSVTNCTSEPKDKDLRQQTFTESITPSSVRPFPSSPTTLGTSQLSSSDPYTDVPFEEIITSVGICCGKIVDVCQTWLDKSTWNEFCLVGLSSIILSLVTESDGVLIKTLSLCTQIHGRGSRVLRVLPASCSVLFDACSPHKLFLSFLNSVGFDAQMILDFIASGDREFFQFFAAYLRYALESWQQLIATCTDLTSSTETTVCSLESEGEETSSEFEDSFDIGMGLEIKSEGRFIDCRGNPPKKVCRRDATYEQDSSLIPVAELKWEPEHSQPNQFDVILECNRTGLNLGYSSSESEQELDPSPSAFHFHCAELKSECKPEPCGQGGERLLVSQGPSPAVLPLPHHKPTPALLHSQSLPLVSPETILSASVSSAAVPSTSVPTETTSASFVPTETMPSVSPDLLQPVRTASPPALTCDNLYLVRFISCLSHLHVRLGSLLRKGLISSSAEGGGEEAARGSEAVEACLDGIDRLTDLYFQFRVESML